LIIWLTGGNNFFAESNVFLIVVYDFTDCNVRLAKLTTLSTSSGLNVSASDVEPSCVNITSGAAGTNPHGVNMTFDRVVPFRIDK
jgi:hypothetical protein